MSRGARRGSAAALAAGLAVLAAPASAQAEAASVDMFGTAFNPGKLTLVAGDTVTWRNGDIVVHDVKGAGFSSGIVGRFESFSQRFDTPGTQGYVCSLHLGMSAQLEVLAATLTAPAGAVFAGETVRLEGRTAPATPSVTIERDAGGGAWRPAGTATPAAGGTFTAEVEAATGYRARTALGQSPAVSATVRSVPKVKLTVAKGRLKVTSSPAAKGLVARFEQRRAGRWRRFAGAKLDSAGRASVMGRGGEVRVVLARGAGGTALATSRTVRL